MNMKLGFKLIAFVLFLFLVAPNGYALTVSPTAATEGTTSYDFGWGTMLAGGGYFDHKTLAGYTATGISGGDPDYVPGEIDGDEFIDFNFNTSVTITDFVIAFLFQDGEYNDTVNEAASVKIWNSDTGVNFFTLEASDSGLRYTWDGAGTVEVLSVPEEPWGGVFKISNPFTQSVGSIKFLAGSPSGSSSAQSDYAIGTMNAVPEPGTLLLFGTGLLGLVSLGRKKFCKKK